MAHLSSIKNRCNDALFVKFHGLEHGPYDAFVAVMERHDGKAEMIGADTLYLIERNFAESKGPYADAERWHMMEAENALAADVTSCINNARLTKFGFHESTGRSMREFTVAASSFPPAIVQEAAADWKKFTGTQLTSRPLRTGPVRS